MASIMQERRREHLNTPHLASASGSIASFQTDMRSPIEEIKIHFNPLQASGTPSPSSPIPIYGWTGCDLNRDGKNLIDDQTATIYDRTLGPAGWSKSSDAKSITAKLKPNTTYTVSIGNSSVSIFRVATLDVDPSTVTAPSQAYIQYFNIGSSLEETTVTTGNTDIWLVIQINAAMLTNRDAKIQVEPGSRASSYEPFVGNKIPVSWSSTYYGGWANPLIGEGVRAYAKFVLDGNKVYVNFSARTNVCLFRITKQDMFPDYMESNNGYTEIKVLSENWPVYTPDYVYNNEVEGISENKHASNNFLWIAIDNSRLSSVTLEGAKAYLAEHPITVVYPLETPTPFSFTPVSPIKTLVGTNNIWSNTNGDVDVRYWKH